MPTAASAAFQLSLDQFLAKRGGQRHRRQGALAEAIAGRAVCLDPAALRRAAGAAARDLGHGDRLRRQRGNQNMLSSIATLAYDCRRSAYFTEHLYAALQLIDRGVLSPAQRGSMHGEVGQTQFMPKAILAYGTGNLENSANALTSTANFLQSPWLARRRRLPAGRAQLRRHPGLERRRRLSEGDRADGPADRRRGVRAVWCEPQLSCRPGLDPGPITTGGSWVTR